MWKDINIVEKKVTFNLDLRIISQIIILINVFLTFNVPKNIIINSKLFIF